MLENALIDDIPYTQKYAFTITLHPKVRRLGSEAQYHAYSWPVCDFIQKKFPKCRLYMVTELTTSFDLHFHGVIQFDRSQLRKNQNMPRYFREAFRGHVFIGFVLLKPIDDEVKWLEYCIKTEKEFKIDMNLNPLIIDQIYNIFDDQ